MKKIVTAVASILVAMVCIMPASAWAQADQPLGEHYNGGLGFHTTSAPVGFRWWFPGQTVGLDVGVGFASDPAPLYSDEKITSWAVDVGVPFVMKSWSKVHVLFRPGLLYSSQQVVTTAPPAAFDTDNATSFNISAEIEGEIFLMDNASVSASHGIRFNSFSPAGGGDSITSFETIGNNFTEVGFHLYFFGGGH